MFMENKKDLVSVIVRTKDRPKLLNRALESIVNQNYPKIEIIVVNDGGGDVAYLINQFKKNIKQGREFVYITNKVSLMRSRAANLGLKTAKGKYVCLLDDDDYFLENHLSEHITAQKEQNRHWSASKTRESREDIDGKEKEQRSGRSYEFNELKFLFFENYFPSNSVVFQKTLMEKVGSFDKNLEVLEDWDIWIRMYLTEKPVFIEKETSVYTTRKGENNVRTSVKSRNIWNDCFMKIMAKYQNNGYDLKGFNFLAKDIFTFLPNHSMDWYTIKESNKELKDSWAFKIYQSSFYKLLKKIK